MVYVRVHSLCCTFLEFWQMYKDMHPTLQAHIQSFHCPKGPYALILIPSSHSCAEPLAVFIFQSWTFYSLQTLVLTNPPQGPSSMGKEEVGGSGCAGSFPRRPAFLRTSFFSSAHPQALHKSIKAKPTTFSPFSLSCLTSDPGKVKGSWQSREKSTQWRSTLLFCGDIFKQVYKYTLFKSELW